MFVYNLYSKCIQNVRLQFLFTKWPNDSIIPVITNQTVLANIRLSLGLLEMVVKI